MIIPLPNRNNAPARRDGTDLCGCVDKNINSLSSLVRVLLIGEVTPHLSGLSSVTLYFPFPSTLGGTIAQGSIILPIPETDNQYIIVNTHVDYDEELMRVPGEKLFYSIVDMNPKPGSGHLEMELRARILLQYILMPQMGSTRYALRLVIAMAAIAGVIRLIWVL